MEKVYIDIFAGCGGISLGLMNSGLWKGLFAIEINKDAFSTLKYNLIENKKHFEWPEWLPIENIDIYHLLIKYRQELVKLKGHVDLVVGGPPCQGFSTAGRRKEDDTRNNLINSYIKFIRLVQPKVIFFENVKGFTQKFKENKTKGKIYSDYVINSLKRNGKDYIGYNVYGKLIDFSEYGVPQKRTRFILVGIRKDYKTVKKSKDFFNLLAENRDDFLLNKGLEINSNLQDAISDLLANNIFVDSPDSKGFMSSCYLKTQSKFQKIMRQGVDDNIPDSHRFANHGKETIKLFKNLNINTKKGKRLSVNERQQFNVKKRSIVVLHPLEPTPTITTHPDDYIHYCEPRILTVREYARIQTFPDNYEFKGKYTTGGELRVKEVPRYSQIGNAIPPLFGELVGVTLKEIFNI